MSKGTIQIVAQVGSISINKTITKTADHPNPYGPVTLPAGKAASSWVRTDADTAACNLATGHGYESGKMDFFWTTDGVAQCRYDVDVTVSTNALTIDGGTGDEFPASSVTDVIVTTPVQINTAIDCDATEMLVLCSSVAASVYFEDADGDAIAQFDLVADEPYVWHNTTAITNPITGDPIVVCFVSNGTAAAGTVTILALDDSTP